MTGVFGEFYIEKFDIYILYIILDAVHTAEEIISIVSIDPSACGLDRLFITSFYNFKPSFNMDVVKKLSFSVKNDNIESTCYCIKSCVKWCLQTDKDNIF